MKIVEDTGIYGQVVNAINNATACIDYIRLTQEEMDDFISTPRFSIRPIDKHYASNELNMPLQIKSHKKRPISCWFMQTQIRVV